MFKKNKQTSSSPNKLNKTSPKKEIINKKNNIDQSPLLKTFAKTYRKNKEDAELSN